VEDAHSWEIVDKVRPWTTNAERTWHYHKRAQVVREARERFGWEIRAAGVPRLRRIVVEAQPLAKDRRWRPDIAACYPTVKAGIDALVDVGVIPDDNPDHVVKLTFWPVDVCGVDGLRLIVREVEA
jgi:crossover junction endodeoxyribonuclease RusA